MTLSLPRDDFRYIIFEESRFTDRTINPGIIAGRFYETQVMEKPDFSKPEATTACFYNSLFGHTRNWPGAYSCLGAIAREKCESMRKLQSFADYWEDRLSFLEDLVRKRHQELPYRHRTCFLLNMLRVEERLADRAVVSLELVENHLPPQKLVIFQTKLLAKHGQQWLLTDGKLEGNLDEIITVRGPGTRVPR